MPDASILVQMWLIYAVTRHWHWNIAQQHLFLCFKIQCQAQYAAVSSNLAVLNTAITHCLIKCTSMQILVEVYNAMASCVGLLAVSTTLVRPQ